MTQGCVSESSHIRAMPFASENQMFIISASIRVVHWNLNRNVSLDIVSKGYSTKQTRSPLRIFACLNWAYAPLLQKQFCRNVNNRQRIKMSSRSNFRKRKSKEL